MRSVKKPSIEINSFSAGQSDAAGTPSNRTRRGAIRLSKEELQTFDKCIDILKTSGKKMASDKSPLYTSKTSLDNSLDGSEAGFYRRKT